MDSRIFNLRTPVELLARIDEIARMRKVSRSALIAEVLECYVGSIQKRGYFVPPYQGDELLRNIRINRRRQGN